MKLRISLAGDLGSGKSTVSAMLLKKYNAEYVSAGSIQRNLAKEKGMTIEEFNRFMENDPAFDKKLDDYLHSYEYREGEFIFDSRLAWHFIPSTLSFYLKVDPRVAAERVFLARREDEGYSSVEHALSKLTARRESEVLRYKKYYGLDILDMSNYDKVIDTTNLTPEEVVEIIEQTIIESNTKK